MPNPPRRFRFVQVDVFTTKVFEGNSLAVFPDARGLSDAEMQAVAREMNLSETTFVLPRDPGTEREQGQRVRIFTVAEELPFAGHPTLGSAFVLRGDSGADLINLHLNVGNIPVKFRTDEHGLSFGQMRQRDPEFGPTHSRKDVARAIGLAPDEIEADLPIQDVSTGLPFVIVPLRRLKTIQSLRLDFNRALEYLGASKPPRFFYFVCRETVDPAARIHARMIFYNGEDPATGSAAGCAASWMVRHGVARSGESVIIEQGIEMHRPSCIVVCASLHDDRVVNVDVGGNCVEVLRGEIAL
ncbi:MAG: PhzF family phenazine biosynthesis protein [Terriglobales bacterium]